MIFSNFEINEYLTTKDYEFSIEEKKWLFKCRLEDIDIPRKWKNESILCGKSNDIEFDQRHLFECKYLIGKNETITYIPKYEDHFIDDLQEQIYASIIIRENYTIMKASQTM